jgi:hypothetical protein
MESLGIFYPEEGSKKGMAAAMESGRRGEPQSTRHKEIIP